MVVVQVFEVGFHLAIDDQSEPDACREWLEIAIRRQQQRDEAEFGQVQPWPLKTTVRFTHEFLRRPSSATLQAIGGKETELAPKDEKRDVEPDPRD